MVAKVIPEKRTCPVCGGSFLVGGEGRKKRSTVTCSWPCRDQYRHGTRGHGKECQPLPDADAAYLAGMIDADGSVGIYGDSKRKHRVQVTISNTDYDFLLWVKQVTSVGSVNKQRAGTAHWKPTFQWCCTSKAAVTFLTQLAPFMRVKKDRAQLAIEFHLSLETPDGRLNVAQQDTYRAQMMELNHRGPVNIALETEPPAGWK